MKKKDGINRGKPQEWSDEELEQLALDIKYKLKGQKITPSLLQRETGVGRNTWSRRLKDYLDELNKPIIRSLSLDGSDDIELPNIEFIFNKYQNNKNMLKDELLQIEEIIYQLYTELKKYKDKKNMNLKDNEEIEIQELKNQLILEKKRADHFEQLYNTIVASSLFPHLHDQSPVLKELGIKDNLINFKSNKEKNMGLNNLSTHFPDVSGETIIQRTSEETNKKIQDTMSRLKGMFDV